MEMRVSFDDVDRWIRDASYPGTGGRGNARLRRPPGRPGDGRGRRIHDPRPRQRRAVRFACTCACATRSRCATQHRRPADAARLQVDRERPGLRRLARHDHPVHAVYAGHRRARGRRRPPAAGVRRAAHQTCARSRARCSASRAPRGSIVKRVGAAARYQAWFGRRLLRAYAGAPVTQSRPSFPLTGPSPTGRSRRTSAAGTASPATPGSSARSSPIRGRGPRLPAQRSAPAARRQRRARRRAGAADPRLRRAGEHVLRAAGAAARWPSTCSSSATTCGSRTGAPRSTFPLTVIRSTRPRASTIRARSTSCSSRPGDRTASCARSSTVRARSAS